MCIGVNPVLAGARGAYKRHIFYVALHNTSFFICLHFIWFCSGVWNTAREMAEAVNGEVNHEQSGLRDGESGLAVKVQTINELHSLQMKRSEPGTPVKGAESARSAPKLESIR